MKIGILGFQGAVIEHQRHIEQLGQEAVVVRYTEQLAEIDGIILPGGESTTMGKLLNRTGMMEPLREKIQQGMPVWGTCAGMILLAKELDQDPVVHLGMMDITVRRNAYGTQIDSFDTQVVIPEVSDEQIPLVFIRAGKTCRRCPRKEYAGDFFSSGVDRKCRISSVLYRYV